MRISEPLLTRVKLQLWIFSARGFSFCGAMNAFQAGEADHGSFEEPVSVFLAANHSNKVVT